MACSRSRETLIRLTHCKVDARLEIGWQIALLHYAPHFHGAAGPGMNDGRYRMKFGRILFREAFGCLERRDSFGIRAVEGQRESLHEVGSQFSEA